ncbi:uncharacterized protein [Neodiprion pinetum]|uniref:uncharacterized protein n=1 Tax=Neodiprion pinetum TaxID=441929 RepID=UPI00371EDA24
MDNLTSSRQRVKQGEVQEHLDSKGSRGHARGRGARARGQALVRGISWPPLENTVPGGTPGHLLAPNVLAETAGGINVPPQVVPEETPTRYQQQQGNKRKGDELTPPENAALSDGELFLPRRLEVEGTEIPRHQTATTEGEGKGTASPSGEEEAARTLLGARPKRKKRCTAIVKGTYLEDDSEAGESGSEWSAQGSNLRPTKNPSVGKRKARAAARSPKKIPQGAGPVEYRLMSASDLGAQLMEWLEDIDAIRMRCKSMQGRLSEEMKKKVGLAKEALLTLTVKAEAAGDPALLQARNADLEAQLRDTRRERDELQRELEKNREGRERPQTEIANRATSSYAQVASRGPVARAGERRSEAAQTTTVLDLGAATRRSEVEANEGPTMATSVGASEFELRLTGSELRLIPDSDRVRDEEMARQSAALKQVREEVGRISLLLLDASSKSGAADQDPLGKGTAQPRGTEATTEKVQRSSGNRGATDTPMEVDDGADAENDRGGWRTKMKRKGKRLGEGVPSGAAVETTQTAPTGALRRTAEDRPTVARRRAPRTAAVAIKSRGENTPYAEVLKFAREKIQLAELGIEETRVRRAANGGVLIEIPGPENARKADALAAQLTKVILDKYGNVVSVTRPVIKGELRVLGLDDSVSAEELARTLAEQGGCKVEEVRVGVPRRTPNGLYSAWAQCPLRAAVAVATKGKVRIGWTTARVELLEARPRQCYKCWGFGHIGSTCKASTERRAACYRCSAEGHQARDCTANPKCAVCEGRGIDSAHRMGSGRCTSVGERGRRPATNASENGQQVVLEREIDVCLVSEPYATPSVATWLSSDDGRAAIYWRAEGNVRGGSLVKRGRGYVAAKFGDIIAISVYISPNILIAEFTEHLDDLARVIQLAENSGRGVLVGGDFNARSPTWDPSGSNRRGELLEEWAASCGVRLDNTGRTATCIRAQGSSVVDLTWSSVNLVPVIKGWRVLEETETLSDHRYISYEVGTPRCAEHRGRKGHMRWNWSKFSPEHLTDALSLTLSWGPTGGDYTTPEGLAGWIERAMTQACDAAAPRARTGNRSRKATYWRSEELADIRRSCIAARRRLARGRRTADDRQEKEAEYRAAKRVLRDGIKAAKAKAWRDLISSVEADPWGLSYKLVLGKLHVEYINGDGELRSLAVTAGVPQGSVLGPLLWNLTFDEVLRGEGVADCVIVCYADDTLVLSSAGDSSTAVALANAMVARVVRRISGLGLTVAASKTEAVLFRRVKKGEAPNTPDVRVGAERVLLSGSMKYLGVRLDPGLTFKAHFASMETRLGGVTRTLARLMPNLRGPSESRRRLYAQTLFAVIMYGAPVWGDVARSSKYIQQVITRCQRRICARVVAAYRTASFVAVSMLARTPPLYLVADAYKRTFHRVRELRSTRTWSQSMVKAIREEKLRVAREQWRVDLGSAGLPSERLRLAILANWTGWFDRAHGSMTFRVTQVLTGHGYFADFLYRIGKTERPTCWYCRLEEDTVSHTVEACPAWRDERNALKRAVGEDLTPPGLIRAMVGSREGWVAVASFAERVMTAKEQRERLRQRTRRSVHRATRLSGRNGGGSRVSAGMT